SLSSIGVIAHLAPRTARVQPTTGGPRFSPSPLRGEAERRRSGHIARMHRFDQQTATNRPCRGGCVRFNRRTPTRGKAMAAFTQGITFTVLGIAALALAMLVPLSQVNDLVREREGRAREATARVAERWGGQQRVGGPVMVVPVRWQEQHETGLVMREERGYVCAD